MRKHKDPAKYLDKLIKRYRGYILENLYREAGYTLDKIVALSDHVNFDVIMIIYKRKLEK